MADLDKILSTIYKNPRSPGSLGGVEALWREAKKKVPDLSRKQVRDWLSGNLVYTLHKPLYKRFKRNPIIVENPLELMQADLVDMRLFAKENQGYNYILTAIDVFSKKAFAIPIKTKSMDNVKQALNKIFSKFKPFKFMTDKGKEFENQSIKQLTKMYNIHHYFAENPEIKCAVVERFNRTLKNKLGAMATLRGSRKYIDVIDDVILSYNDRYHRSIKMPPNNVTFDNANLVFKNLYGFNNKREYLRSLKKPKLTPGVTVRKKYNLKHFDRGYYPNWTDQIYTIYKSIPGYNKPYYHIKDEQGSLLKKRFYPEEVQKVKTNLFRIEKILKQKTQRGKKYYYVKWLNTEAPNEWIPAENLFNING